MQISRATGDETDILVAFDGADYLDDADTVHIEVYTDSDRTTKFGANIPGASTFGPKTRFDLTGFDVSWTDTYYIKVVFDIDGKTKPLPLLGVWTNV